MSARQGRSDGGSSDGDGERESVCGSWRWRCERAHLEKHGKDWGKKKEQGQKKSKRELERGCEWLLLPGGIMPTGR